MRPERPPWRPTTSAAQLRARAALLARVRAFFAERGVMEVETPVLSRAGNSDPGIEQLSTRAGHWLRTSPEYPMKRLLAAGSGDIYELSRVFRAGEAGAWHNPEFTLLEWYRVGWRFERLMDEVAALILHCGEAFGRRWRIERKSYRDWVQGATGIDPLTADPDTLGAAIEAAGIDAPLEALDRNGRLDLLISHLVQPAMAPEVLTLVHHYPADQAALAQLSKDDPRLAERFEVFVGGVELANGYGELTDATEQRARFEAENRRRIDTGAEPVPLDEALLAALGEGLPACSGVALGVDRLLMVLTGAERIDQVIALPADRA